MKKTFSSSVEEKAAERTKNVSGRIVVGFSGGADSTVLMTVASKLFGSDNIVAVHVNHMLRGEDADSDERFCRDFCAARNIKFIARRVDVKAMCGGKAFEETARNVRYGIFDEIAKAKGAEYVALAHTQSDNLETVLFNLFRGSGLSGMRGIPYSRPCGNATVIRPLIDCTRDEILGYAKENALAFVTDKTNADTHYTRNFIRANIVPQIKTLFPQAEKAVGNMSDAAALDYDFISRCAFDFISENASGKKLPVKELRALHPALRRRVITALYGDALDSVHCAQADELISSGDDGKVVISGGVFAQIENGVFFFSGESHADPRPEFSISLKPGKNESPDGFLIIVGEGVAPEGYTLVGEADVPQKLADKLTARSRRASDKYRFWKMTRTLKKLVASLPPRARKIRPVICDGDSVIWYPGFPPAEFPPFCERDLKIKYYESTSEVQFNA